jgi:hypothetical protein
MRLPRFRLSTLLAIVASLAIAMVVVPAVWRFVSLDWVDDAYAVWGAADMVVNYMEDHDGRWPKGWGDIKPYFDAGGGRVGGWSFEEYQRRVAIRWDVDPAVLEAASKASPGPTFQVISARQGAADAMGGREPNEIIYRYFRGKTQR